MSPEGHLAEDTATASHTCRHVPGSSSFPGTRSANPANWKKLTCRTMGSCSGGFLFSTPIVSHTWNAVSCSAKNGLCCGTGRGR